ncbi:response regulator [Paenibacillus sp. HJL G12]|uniref:Response regulator n=1 Tax=Paenibacillus dendrobii TaxID=2691084 RepID=A0A7X3IL12_9BACL|nr:response regulator [Paenibacillus dendrobii]MWV43997.1 response regulator [Paenibacillus dendrobii]
MLKDHSFKILIAEDEKIILEHIVEKIDQARLGFEVVATAMNGEDALELVKHHKPDVLFTDVKMPLMDGIQLTHQVKKLYPDLHIVILSGYDNFEYAQQALRLGVSDYLLKPMTPEGLLGTLSEIKIELEQRNTQSERSIISQFLNGHQPINSNSLVLQNSKFMLYLICIGNLYRHIMDDIDVRNINKMWDMVHWNQLMNSLEPVAKWWVLDDKNCNVKILVTATNNNDYDSLANAANEIQNILGCYIHTSPITLSTHLTPVHLGDLWKISQKLSTSLEKGLVPGKSTIIRLEDPKQQEPMSPLDPVAASTIEKFARQGKFGPLTLELSRLFEEWKSPTYTQLALEKRYVQLARLLSDHLDNPRLDAAVMESEIHRILATASHLADISQNMLKLFTDYLPVSKKLDSAGELYVKLEEYIRLHFTQAINVDHLAHTFQFNASYIIRVFKKYHGIPPLQYLISLRINEAKRLIKEKPEMDIKDISEIIGYTDQHYFSRVFRSWTGMNPSEYRDSVKKNLQM